MASFNAIHAKMEMCFSNETVSVPSRVVDLELNALLFRYYSEITIVILVQFCVPFIIIGLAKMFKAQLAPLLSRQSTPSSSLQSSAIESDTNDSGTNYPMWHIRRVNYCNRRSVSCFCVFKSPHKTAETLDEEDMKKIVFDSRKEEQESPSGYVDGGYMRLSPGAYLDGRYKVLRKLGFGHFSTVWLCESLSDRVAAAAKHVAIKICKSELMYTDVAEDEISLLTFTKEQDPEHAGYNRVVQMIESFRVGSMNGIHTAIAMEIMGPSLFNLLQYSNFKGIGVNCVRTIIKQMCVGLTYLHDRCRIIHTDIKPENVLIKVNQHYIDELVAKAQKFEHSDIGMPKGYVTIEEWQFAFGENYEPPESTQTLEERDATFYARQSKSYPYDEHLTNLKRHSSTHSINGPIWVNPNIEIKIADMGNGCWEDRHFSAEIQTREYRALEVILDADYCFPADMWSVGCTAFELATGELLFHPRGRGRTRMDIDHLCLIWETLGEIPKYITEKGRNSSLYFLDGKIRAISEDDIKIWKVEDVLVQKYGWKRVDAIPMAEFVEGLIEPDPALRLTASTALQHSWFQESES